jgi:predicted dehydrogenase
MHVSAFRAAGAPIVGWLGRDPKRTRALCDQEGVPLAAASFQELCEACEGLVVASPDRLHREHVLMAWQAGKHVLCEKPLARTLDEARALVSALPVGSSLVSAVVFPYRMIPAMRALRGFVSERSPCLSISLRLRTQFLSWGGATDGQRLGESGDFGGASHVIDLALWLSRMAPRRVQAVMTGRPSHRLAVLVELEGDCVLVLEHQPTIEPGIHADLRLSGANWEAAVGARYDPAAVAWTIEAPRVFGGGRLRSLDVEPPPPGALEPWAQAHVDTARAFLAATAGEQAGELASIRDGARVQAILDAALRSAEAGRAADVERF